MSRPALTALAVLLAAACSRAEPSAPAPFDPVGSYDFVATRGTDSRPGTLDIVRTGSGLDAEARLVGESQPALADSIALDGTHMRIFTLVGGGDAVDFDLRFEGASFAGVIIAGIDTIAISGQRRAP